MLLIPGPVEVTRPVMDAGSYLCNHRSDEFRAIVNNIENSLNSLTGSHRAVVTTGSGTLAVESMVFSLINKNDKVVALTQGPFGDRLAASVRRASKNAEIINIENKNIMEIIEEKDFDKLFMVHNETGYGVAVRNINDVARAVKNKGSRIIIDSVSGYLGYKIDFSNIYAMATGSQKNIAALPGTGIDFLSKEAVDDLYSNDVDAPFYLDLKTSLDFLEKNETPYTPSTGAFKSLEVALDEVKKEGMENRIKRIEKASKFIRSILNENNIEVNGDDSNYSNTVVCFKPRTDPDDVIKRLASENIIITKGMGSMKNYLRIGTMGIINSHFISRFLNSYFKIEKINDYVDESEVKCDLPEFLEIIEA
ncbi:pyridoxal-phosphate-dependent aminotransferase family protein [Picrophilus oshimae]|uniref:Aspartate aminotransferase n=1 Tax=Picrophilus torridus (strain ATCC 700027 / DSM 9790 / JCM 10055 / NBRC 100828 / KAW 2/3) TaxID=1122961 RepID=A0A8G2FWG4_PICTO|nr:aminotransferase class V-fold PLP-dependent enzyme [Picrophilus oshimae]SMD30742.1 aspartate aminotransferase [Picrophilus oshimae DSM 9789]